MFVVGVTDVVKWVMGLFTSLGGLLAARLAPALGVYCASPAGAPNDGARCGLGRSLPGGPAGAQWWYGHTQDARVPHPPHLAAAVPGWASEMSEPTFGVPPVSGYADPPGEPPWVMQLVIRVEKADPPTRTAACAAAATATALLLADAQAGPGGPWEAAVDRWMAGRIRKHARRARGAAWDRVALLPGVTVVTGGACVRAFVPCPTDAIPPDIARLQMSGLELADPRAAAGVLAVPGGPVVVSICPDPVLPAGKAAAAAAHGAQLAAMNMSPARLALWAAAGFPVALEQPPASAWQALRASAQVVVVDAGLTSVAPGTVTALARWA